MLLQVRDDAGLGAAEVFLEPVVDARDPESPAGDGGAARMVDVAGGALGHQRAGVGARVGRAGEVRAADRGAVDRVVHARLVVGARLAQRVVLDAVERELAPEKREEPVLERVAENLAEIPDRPDVGVAHEDLLDGEGIVGVDQERHALRPRPAVELGLAHLRERGKIRLQRLAVLLHARIVHLRRLAAVDEHYVLLQQRIPGLVRMVERLRQRGGGKQGKRERGQPPHPRLQA